MLCIPAPSFNQTSRIITAFPLNRRKRDQSSPFFFLIALACA